MADFIKNLLIFHIMRSMKYAVLKQIQKFLSEFRKITSVKRVGDMIILICFDAKFELFFDLSKSSSAIYTNDEFVSIKEYKAPFDVALKKRFNNSKILSAKVIEGNRILKISCVQEGSYKSSKSSLYLEFTGRFTNAIITDENEIIIEALRHIDNSFRQIKPYKALIQLEPIEIKEKPVDEILDFHKFFKDEFSKINDERINSLKQIKSSQILKKIESLNSNLDALEDEEELRKQSDKLSKEATLLLANLSKVKEYEREFSLIDFDGRKVKFSLEDSAKNSVNLFFNKAKRLKQKAVGVVSERLNLNEKLSFYLNLLNLIKNAKSASELEILYPRRANNAKRKEQISDNVEAFYINDYKILVGRNEKGNVNLLKNAKKDDIWLHLKDIASAHVIIKTAKTSPSEDVLRFAAKLCVEFSVKGAGNYEVDYTKRSNVKINDAANVNYIDFKTIIVTKD